MIDSISRGIVAIAAGNAAGRGVSGAVRRDGTVWMWGDGGAAMMGNGGERPSAPDAAGGRNLLPVQVKGIVGAQHLAIGGGSVAALPASGILAKTWKVPTRLELP